MALVAMSGAEVTLSAALEPDLVEEVRSRQPRGLPQRERALAWSLGLCFLLAAVPLAMIAGSMPSLPVLALVIGLYALVSRVQFEFAAGWAVPTQLVFVPMLFVLPPAIVPLCVAAAIVLSEALNVIRGGIHPHRLALCVGSAAHALGPAIVLAALAPGPPAVDRWPIYVVALAAQFASDFVSTAPWARVAYGVALVTHLRQLSWTWLVDTALSPIGIIVASVAVVRPAGVLVVAPLVGLIAFFAREREVRIDHALELSKAYRGTAMLLGDVIEADDEYTGHHSRDVVDLVLLVAEGLGLEGPMRRDAEFAALLHDVGKVKIPSEIINKPGSLDDREWEIMKTHTIAGEEMLERVGGLLGRIGKIVRSCHERWDGKGYPDGLEAEKIPLIARIVMCCDAFSAMTTDRSYRKAMTDEAAIEELLRCSGTHFDPRVVDVLVAAIGKGRPPLALAA
jgi:HD-GYP domain-containing protein (c-di-GMP phosphodiesterase class II)